MSASQAIRERIAAHAPGEPFTPAMFAGLGSRAAIDQTLMRLAKAGAIERIGHGLYVVPAAGRFGVKAAPSAEKVAQVVADAKGESLEIHGAEAARRLGLTTQMPAQAAFYTTGPSREIRLGKMTLKLQHAASRKLVLAGRPAGQALSALWYLGREQVTENTFRTIAEKLPRSEFQALRAVKASMPAWMVHALSSYERTQISPSPTDPLL
ncbi:DUF6088 family protein [Achromobacter aloeverae]|uniref:Type IV toxin-antitoxin system AbiEi family antitoxin domain-containing protein n=1 Tax=Achromobacter aloeverae TaxID=1750518 RepID=A0A4Q1HKH5_9BURK|nr:DUF6088 family protein [Achromobacter aloeverae]RXN90449.1 hypothetical protein C7R54_13185 [Achromobacter aloeverae]